MIMAKWFCLMDDINYNPEQNIWNKIEKFSKTGQDKKILISPFACFLTAIAKVYFLEGGLGTRPSLALVEIFLTLAHSLKS